MQPTAAELKLVLGSLLQAGTGQSSETARITSVADTGHLTTRTYYQPGLSRGSSR